MKYFELKKLVETAQPLIKDVFVDKIDIINKKTLQIRLNQKIEQRKLVLIAKPQEFFFIGEQRLEAPKQPLSATSAFRKYLNNCILKDVEIIPNNRIVKISFKKHCIVSHDIDFTSTKPQTFYLFIEFFSSCSFILTNADLEILALSRYYKDKNRELKVHNLYIVPESKEIPLPVVAPASNIHLLQKQQQTKAFNNIFDEQKKQFWENFEKSQSSASLKGEEKIEMFQKATLKKYLRQKDEFAKKGKFILDNLYKIQQEFEEAKKDLKECINLDIGGVILSLDLNKTPQKQARDFFEKSKKTKEKIAKIEQMLKKAEKNKRKKESQKSSKKLLEIKECTEFYTKYHWFFSSSGFLCFGGRSAEQNEDILRNLVKKDDIILHTDTPGSPFFIIRSDIRKIDEQTIQEASQATVSYSRYWKNNYSAGIANVFAPYQVKKEKNLPLGTFLVEGKIRKMRAILEIAIGIDKTNQVIGGPTSAILQEAKNYVILQPGKKSKSEIMKIISEKLKIPKPAIEKFLPSGEYKIIS